MIIDVGLSSCARVELLEDSMQSFKESVITKHKLRWIIVEDEVDDPRRQERGRKWIVDNFHYFDKIVYSGTKLTHVFCFGEMLKHIESDYFIRWEDDFKFQRNIDIDPMFDVLEHDNENMANISFKRNYCDTSNFMQFIDGRTGDFRLASPLFSIGPGVFNTKLTREIVDYSGTGECHEYGVLTPSMNKLGYKSYIWGSKEDPFLLDHVGKNLGFNKGDYK